MKSLVNYIKESKCDEAKVPTSEKDIQSGYYQIETTKQVAPHYGKQAEVFVKDVKSGNVKLTYLNDGVSDGSWFNIPVQVFLKNVLDYYADAGKDQPLIDRNTWDK